MTSPMFNKANPYKKLISSLTSGIHQLLNNRPSIDVISSDMRRYEFQPSINDLVVVTYSLMYVISQYGHHCGFEVLKSLLKSLKPGGRLLIDEPSFLALTGNYTKFSSTYTPGSQAYELKRQPMIADMFKKLSLFNIKLIQPVSLTNPLSEVAFLGTIRLIRQKVIYEITKPN